MKNHPDRIGRSVATHAVAAVDRRIEREIDALLRRSRRLMTTLEAAEWDEAVGPVLAMLTGSA